MNRKSHWENVYQTKKVDQVSWYRDHLDNSLQLIRQTKAGQEAAIIDVGGGSSTLVDDLLKDGFADLSVLDISARALENSGRRLGRKAELVEWIEADITRADLPKNHYDVWHDRAVFHFLLDADERSAYVVAATRAVKPDGFLIIATFSPDGPTKCSGLPVMRYSPEQLAKQFPKFRVIKSKTEQHETPSGQLQSFTYLLMQRRDSTPY